MNVWGLTSSTIELRYKSTDSMRKGTRLVALVAALPQYCSAVEGCLQRAGVEEASRILGASGQRRLIANLELGRIVLKLLKKSVLSVLAHRAPHSTAQRRQSVRGSHHPLTSHRGASPRFASAPTICSSNAPSNYLLRIT